MKKEKIDIEYSRSVLKEIVFVPDSKGGYTAYFSDREDIIIEGETEKECIEKLAETYKAVKAKEFAEAFKELAQNYLGMMPKDKGCNSWPEMNDKMLGEAAELIEEWLDVEKTFVCIDEDIIFTR